MAATTRRQMSPEHKAALAEGREQGRVIRAYLEALDAHRPRRGRRRSAEAITSRLAAIEAEIPTAEPLDRVHLLQERLDLRAEQAAEAAMSSLAELEAAFVKAVGPYSERKALSYQAWREAGISADLLKRGGLTRAGG